MVQSEVFTSTDLYLYHNDSNFGLRVLHLMYNKARIGYSSDLSEVGMRTSRMNIGRDRCTFGKSHGKSYKLALVDHRTAYLDILCRASPQA